MEILIVKKDYVNIKALELCEEEARSVVYKVFFLDLMQNKTLKCHSSHRWHMRKRSFLFGKTVAADWGTGQYHYLLCGWGYGSESASFFSLLKGGTIYTIQL